MVVRVKEFQTILGKIDEKLNNFLKENKIPKSNIIDIKYTAVATGTMILLVYEDGKKNY